MICIRTQMTYFTCSVDLEWDESDDFLWCRFGWFMEGLFQYYRTTLFAGFGYFSSACQHFFLLT